ncbi:AAA family ATPase [Clostridium sp. SM-530-WT-3G]|uniref:ParA family protein n=1 Tax=Clostridium sp. SM-530-WT-3G TaxID=2725303 RepID=UPI00145E974E|nr:AAA family ATPase [Clostridium sp. SM-530-WT-3G]NME81571.1 AAA family ATPase [Clostridium sp. SM-530-WT-3G]
MADVISFINLKGGVGKTTLLVSVAEILSTVHNKRVLVIDLDPQTNATVLLISQKTWKEANENNKTIYQLFLDKIQGTKVFDVNKSIIRGVSNIGNGIGNLDLLPSSIDLIDIYDEVSWVNHNDKSLSVLKEQLDKLDSQYDYILIDCPPNLNSTTMCGIYSSKYYIVPVIADALSYYGLTQVVKKINAKAREIKRYDPSYSIKPLGVVVNRYKNCKPYTGIKGSLEIDYNSGKIPKLFSTIIYNRSKLSEICNFMFRYRTIKSKYGFEFKTIDSLAKEIIERCR